jgi:hypothetical protein
MKPKSVALLTNAEILAEAPALIAKLRRLGLVSFGRRDRTDIEPRASKHGEPVPAELVDLAVKVASDVFGIAQASIYGSDRAARAVDARSAAFLLLTRRGYSSHAIGAAFHRSHNNVCVCVTNMENRLVETALKADWALCEQKWSAET